MEDDILKNAVPVDEYSLKKIQYWLEYGKHSWSLGVGIFFVPYSLILTALTIAAVIFFPYMLWHLYNAKWYRSAVVLLGFVLLPYIVTFFINVQSNMTYFLISFFPFLSFYLFCYIISYMIGKELIKIKTLKKWKRERRMRR